MVLRQSAKIAVFGVMAGLAAAYAATRLMTNLLFRTSPTDTPTFLAISVLLTLVSLLASYIPARRATRVDPLRALHYE